VRLAVVLVLAVIPAEAQTILGYKFDMREKLGIPATRALKIKSQEALSPETIAGDPATDGAFVQLIVNGATSTSQLIYLPPGALAPLAEGHELSRGQVAVPRVAVARLRDAGRARAMVQEQQR
jgi:hypothetical protein